MTPNSARDKLKEFLYKETDLPKKAFDRIVKGKMAEIAYMAGRDASPSDKDIRSFIDANFSELNVATEKFIDRFCQDAIPESQFWYLVKEFGVLSIFLIPPLIPLASYLATLMQASPLDVASVGTCIAGICLLLALIGTSAYACFKDGLSKAKKRTLFS